MTLRDRVLGRVDPHYQTTALFDHTQEQKLVDHIKRIRRTGGAITRYNICEVACKVYIKSLSVENLQSGFKRTGVFPFDPSVIPLHLLLPAEVFHVNDNEIFSSQSTVEGSGQHDLLDTTEMEL
ncbi:hypothetical protein DPMN_065863 [Dreissena polymorpha]|uniref:Uncharacterized protein n=1 Tax=Dreissena polymorpha TaxID=45954 RepID=A0A9D3YWN8_DREPO|nr:hypothetical protein DPMN_065863 [Dreissena polymorpha]